MVNITLTKELWISALEERHGKGLQNKISSNAVCICGLGGLGSNIAISLARVGIGKLILIDFDKVDISNLNRQQYKACQLGMFKTDALKENLLEIAPFLDIEICTQKLSKKNITYLLKDADIVCEAFDVAESKAMLVNEVLEKMPDKYLVSASGMAGLSDANLIKTRKITNHFYICGDEVSDVNDDIGLVSSRVMVCAAHQAHIVLQIINSQ